MHEWPPNPVDNLGTWVEALDQGTDPDMYQQTCYPICSNCGRCGPYCNVGCPGHLTHWIQEETWVHDLRVAAERGVMDIQPTPYSHKVRRRFEDAREMIRGAKGVVVTGATAVASGLATAGQVAAAGAGVAMEVGSTVGEVVQGAKTRIWSRRKDE